MEHTSDIQSKPVVAAPPVKREKRPVFRLARHKSTMPKARLRHADAGIGPDPTQGIDSTLLWVQAAGIRSEPSPRPQRIEEQSRDTRSRIHARIDRTRYSP